jgi:hypothetical protein
MEWGNRVMDGPLTQRPAGREQVMSVTAKLRKIRMLAVGKVTSINQFLHYDKNEPCGLRVEEGSRSSHNPQVETLKGLILHIAKRKKNVPCMSYF